MWSLPAITSSTPRLASCPPPMSPDLRSAVRMIVDNLVLRRRRQLRVNMVGHGRWAARNLVRLGPSAAAVRL
jgi:hypothetical protein